MNFNNRNAVAIYALMAGLVLLFGFQNCAPALPLEGVLSQSSVRTTPTPIGATPTPAPGGGGGYSGSDIDGICSDDTTAEPMASRYFTSGVGNLVAFTNGAKTAIWKINGPNILHGVVCSMPTSGWSIAGLGDFNGDYQTDILWQNSDGRVAVWLMTGAQRIVTGIIGTIGAGWRVEGTGHFDGDGKADLLWRNQSSGDIKKWTMNGVGAPTEVALGNISPSFVIQGLGDFDGNYRADILSRNSAGDLQFTFITTAGIVGTTSSLPASGGSAARVQAGWNVRGIGDFNGDARADLIIQNGAAGELEIRYMNGAALYTVAYHINAPAAGWTLLYATDLNSDYISDWIWTIPATSDLYLAYTPMSGTPGTTRTLDTITSGYTIFTYPH